MCLPAQTYLLWEKAEALVLTDTFIRLSEYRVEWLTSCSVVSGRVAWDGEGGDENLSMGSERDKNKQEEGELQPLECLLEGFVQKQVEH